MTRKKVPRDAQLEVLTQSGRRCALCFGFKQDTHLKEGQIAHLDGKPDNNEADNLCWLCLDHHNAYDSRPRQAKRITRNEVKHYRGLLYDFVAQIPGSSWVDSPPVTNAPARATHRPALTADLYERRLRIYQAIRKCLTKAANDPEITHSDLFTFVADVEEAIFLFDDGLVEYLDEVYQHGVQVIVGQRELEQMPVGDQRTAKVAKIFESITWLSKQYAAVRTRMIPFMRFP